MLIKGLMVGIGGSANGAVVSSGNNRNGLKIFHFAPSLFPNILIKFTTITINYD